MIRTSALGVACCAGLACATTAQTLAPGTLAPEGPSEISTGQALVYFDSICVKSFPGFDTALSRLDNFGFTIPSPTGSSTRYSPQVDASVQLGTTPNGDKSCSLVFRSDDTGGTFRRTIAGQLETRKVGEITLLIMGDQAAPLITAGPFRNGKSRYFNIRLLNPRPSQ
ncbi:MAG: hypothetical protein AAGA12_03210 [Pseudomonadota bacterium]